MSLDQLRQLAPELWTSPQLQAGDFSDAAKQGFKTIINMRPDHEQGDQPEAADLRVAAERAGLRYEFLPVVSGQFTEQNIVDFARDVAELPKPILTFCRTGTRCANLWALVQAQGDVS
jgi:sulfide:quinone oxidoreductase